MITECAWSRLRGIMVPPCVGPEAETIFPRGCRASLGLHNTDGQLALLTTQIEVVRHPAWGCTTHKQTSFPRGCRASLAA